jgi:hypothetical protein
MAERKAAQKSLSTCWSLEKKEFFFRPRITNMPGGSFDPVVFFPREPSIQFRFLESLLRPIINKGKALGLIHEVANRIGRVKQMTLPITVEEFNLVADRLLKACADLI